MLRCYFNEPLQSYKDLIRETSNCKNYSSLQPLVVIVQVNANSIHNEAATGCTPTEATPYIL